MAGTKKKIRTLDKIADIVRALIPSGFTKRKAAGATLITARYYEAALVSSGVLTRPIADLALSGAAAVSGGRGSALVVNVPGVGDVVVRRYLRGGLIGKILVDRYLFSTRPKKELAVLAYARSRGVPVPEVLGASIIRSALFSYRGRITTRMIPDTRTFPVFIAGKSDDARRVTDVLRKSGAAIRSMHDAGINHADLNMNNILVDGRGKVFIIDFDKATLYRELGPRKRIGNLKRLLRSARKLAKSGLGFSDADFEEILKGYCGRDEGLFERLRDSTVGSRLTALRGYLSRLTHRSI